MPFLKLGLLTLLGAMVIIGCRFPKLYHIRSRPQPVVYDTAWESELPATVDADAAAKLRLQFRDTLAEPVSIIEWNEGASSTWEIFFATNRVPLKTTNDELSGYGNEILHEPEYGFCHVRLPHRERGRDATEPPHAGEANSARSALVEVLQDCESSDFISKLRTSVENSRQHDVLIFVHGFNVSWNQAVLRATQVAADLPFNGAVVVYSWPSQGGVENYALDGEIISASVPAFSAFLTEIGEGLPADCSINLVVHSMGNRLVTNSLWRVPDTFTAPPRFRELVFCAPDVAVDDFRRDARRIREVSERATLYKSGNDTALIASKWRNLDERAGESLGMAVEGIDTIETAVVDTSAMGHSYYGSNPSVLRDLFAVVKEHRPAEQRPWLRRQKLPFTSATLLIMHKFPQPLEWHWHFAESQEKQ